MKIIEVCSDVSGIRFDRMIRKAAQTEHHAVLVEIAVHDKPPKNMTVENRMGTTAMEEADAENKKWDC